MPRSPPPPVSPSPGLRSLLPSAWREVLGPAAQSGLDLLEGFLGEEAAAGVRICPPREQIFAALEAVAPAAVKVVLLGQDPYPTAGVANGLAFSVNREVRPPASLRRLFEGLARDVGLRAPAHGDLSAWAAQGILLLNTVLTVREGAPNSHRGRGWEPLTEAILRAVDAQPAPVVFLCLGRQAQDLAQRLVTSARHVRIEAPHPSPLTGRKFLEAVEREHPFQQVERALASAGRAPIRWNP